MVSVVKYVHGERTVGCSLCVAKRLNKGEFEFHPGSFCLLLLLQIFILLFSRHNTVHQPVGVII